MRVACECPAGGVRWIPLGGGKAALVDVGDYESLSKHHWFAVKKDSGWYALRTCRENGSKRYIYMHREILNVVNAPRIKVDHVNFNGLNNTRANIRLATTSQNGANQRKFRGSSRFKGVFWHKGARKWRSEIKVRQKKVGLGYFDNEERAARQYDRAARLFFGQFALTNEAMGLFAPKQDAA